ncbi:hypothetical protein F2Q69_00036383 [Brassica cretica]|uniref:Uncharacterized protein n=1 Tax=Brassica cretica TaxID=69181 RepID=A0A8S9SP61_BRACR|nr:hypothetical protein F2Q69_00036383 [Brassica cretica]
MTPTESTTSCNAVRILTHEEFAAKHPHPPSPDKVRIARRAETSIDRHGECIIARQTEAAIDRQSPAHIDQGAPITYQVQIPKIDVARLNALRPKHKPSENPPEPVRTPSDDGEDPMEEDRVPTGRNLRRRKEKMDAYYTHRLWMFFRETREKEEDIKRMFCGAREKMRMGITFKKKSDPGQFVIPCTVKGGAFAGTLHFSGLFLEELRKNCERPRACHCGTEYETDYSGSIETHTATSIDSGLQKSTDTPHEESVDSRPNDWENDYYNPHHGSTGGSRFTSCRSLLLDPVLGNTLMELKPIANSRARGRVVEVAEIVEQETEISEMLRRSRS